MPENGFVPLAPRRLMRSIDPASAEMDQAAVNGEARHTVEPVPERGPITAVADDSALELGRNEAVESQLTAAPAFTRDFTDADATRVRAAAIELAASACARALRYAVDRNPRLLARFVDDALRAAGSPSSAIVRIACSAASAGAATIEHDFVADPSLSPGDVFVDCADGTLGATVEERAERLVRAAAS
jgi:hypothetical protein